MNVRKSPEGLIGVQLDQNHWDWLLHLVVVLQDSEHRLWNVVHDHVEVDLVWLVALGVEGMLQSDHVGVEQFFHDLQFAVLVPLVLVHLLDGHFLVVLVHSRLEHDAEAPIAHHSLGIVGKT